MITVAHRSQIHRASPQTLLAAIEAAGQQVAPQADASLATTVKTGIAVARVCGGAGQASHHPLVSRSERARDDAIADS